MNLTVVKELQPLQPDQGIAGQVLMKTPQPQGMRGANQNRVATVNRLLQNGLNVPLNHDKPTQHQTVTTRDRSTVVVAGNFVRPTSASRLNESFNPQQMRSPAAVNQSLPQLHKPQTGGHSAPSRAQPPVSKDQNNTEHTQPIRLGGGDRSFLAAKPQQERVALSQDRAPPQQSYNSNQRVVSPPKINRVPLTSVGPAGNQCTQETPQNLHQQTTVHLHPNQVATSLPVGTVRMDVRQPMLPAPRAHPLQNRSLEQRNNKSPHNPETNYPSKLISLGRKIDQIVSINESLETKIQVMRQHQQSKEQENIRLKKRIADLNEKLRLTKKESEDIEAAAADRRTKLQQQISRIREAYSDTIGRLQTDLVQARTTTQTLQENVKNLQRECRHKDRQLSKYKDFFLQMQTGFDSMRDRPP